MIASVQEFPKAKWQPVFSSNNTELNTAFNLAIGVSFETSAISPTLNKSYCRFKTICAQLSLSEFTAVSFPFVKLKSACLTLYPDR